MWSQRRILAVVAAALLVTTVAYLLVRDPDPDAQAVDLTGETTTTRASDTSTTADAVPSSTTSSSTTTAPAAPTAATPTTGAAAAGQPRSAGTTTTTVVAPPFAATVVPVSAADLGSSWREGCPVGPDQLRAVDAVHWGYDGVVHPGRVIVAADQADAIVAVLRDLYDARFPIQRMVPVDRYGSDDHASMVDNNTSAFNCRAVAGTTKWSEHAFGAAIDVNPLVNPYVKGSTVDPPEGATWADRSRQDPGMIHDGDAAVAAFARHGWGWGGHWASGKDYQHFSASGR
jgi:hypothetical protein